MRLAVGRRCPEGVSKLRRCPYEFESVSWPKPFIRLVRRSNSGTPVDNLKGADAMPADQTKRKELWGRWVAALCARDLRAAEKAAEEMCDQDYVVHSPK